MYAHAQLCALFYISDRQPVAASSTVLTLACMCRKTKQQQEEGWSGSTPAERLAKLQQTGGCKDEDEECPGWAEAGECTSKPQLHAPEVPTLVPHMLGETKHGASSWAPARHGGLRSMLCATL